ncbi:MAG: outer membrane protein assembly factor BamE [Alphaproteobacteria bacterium]|nr:outer membrane protein assembly factor BamE [Alphaproteobacteria bacterium]
MRLITSLVRRCAGIALVSLLAACTMPQFMSYPPQVRGNRIDKDRLAELVPGTSTRGDVTSLLGSPTMKATFNENTWFYLSEVTRPQIGATQNVLEQQSISVTFDAKGVLTAIDVKTEANARDVSVVSRSTPAPGTDSTFFQQLFGNIGRFGPGFGGGSGPGSGTSSGNY